MESKKIQILVGSTRPGRINKQIAEWLAQKAKEIADMNVEIVDLADYDLPFLDEPMHPSMHRYSKEHTLAWSKIITEGSGYIWVTPEYNAGYSAVLKNAIDYLYQEWGAKPVLVASYGVGGGSSANHQLVEVAERLKMIVSEPGIELTISKEMRGEDGLLKNPEVDFEQYHESTVKALKALDVLVSNPSAVEYQ